MNTTAKIQDLSEVAIQELISGDGINGLNSPQDTIQKARTCPEAGRMRAESRDIFRSRVVVYTPEQA